MIQSLDIPTIRPNNLEKIMEVANNPVDFNNVVTGLKTHKYFRPSSFKVDLRNGNVMSYVPFRRKRKKKNKEVSCSVCEKDLPPIILSHKLPNDDYCFVSENPYCFFNPDIAFDIVPRDFKGELSGINFLLWPTTTHCDIQNMDPEIHSHSFYAMGIMEQKIIDAGYPWAFFGKNMGHSPTFKPMHSQYHIAGIRLFQIQEEEIKEGVRTELFPGDIKYLNEQGISYAKFTKENNEHYLSNSIIRDYGDMVVAVHPDMRRALEMIIYPKDTSIEKIQDLNESQRLALAKATSDISYSLSTLMPAMDMDEDYCFVYHNAGGTFYVEAFPASQPVGFSERARIYQCESSPAHSGDILKEYYSKHVPQDWRDRDYRSMEFVDFIKHEIIEPIDNKHIREYEDKVHDDKKK
ncbi:MAG: hypothetical protein WC867_02820 [Candidatus Pacearchaeota archaeon]|jgi:hypothetical protein